MYTFYLAGLISSIVIFFTVRRVMRRSLNPVIDSCGFSAAILLVMAIMAAITGLAVNSNLPQKTVVGGPYTLVSIRSADGLSGKFIYGTGSISGSVFYNVYVRNEDGSVTPYQVPADSSVRIVEESSLHDSGTWMQAVTSYDYSSPLGRWVIGQDYKTIRYKVPVGTVVHDFSVK